jgi:hypothetical protein
MARLIHWGLQSAGHDVTRAENSFQEDRTNIVFGFHEWFKPKENPLAYIRDYDCILYQAEQLSPGGRQMPDWYFGGLRHCKAVWDYSVDNVEIAHRNGIPSIHVPPAWHEKYEPIESMGDDVNIDVLFIGALNGRRTFLVQLLGQLFDEVHVLQSTWGIERDEFMARSKMLINIHFYKAQTLELLRLAHALNSGLPVISEESPNNPWSDAIATAPYEGLARKVMELWHSPNDLTELGLRGQEAFRSTSMTEVVKQALDGETPSMATNEAADQCEQPVRSSIT